MAKPVSLEKKNAIILIIFSSLHLTCQYAIFIDHYDRVQGYSSGFKNS